MATKKTGRFDPAIHFLASALHKHRLEAVELDKRIKAMELMSAIYEKKAAGGRISNKEYEELVKLQCPNSDFLRSLSVDLSDDESDDDFPFWAGCSSTDCISCWKHYLSVLSDTVNRSPVCVKLPEGGDPDDN